MWTRYDLKMNAKMAFKRNYWTCVAASLVVGVLSGSMFAGSGSGVQTTLEVQHNNPYAYDSYSAYSYNSSNSIFGGSYFFFDSNRDFAGDCFVSFVIYDFCRKCGIGRRMQIFYGEQRASDKCFKGVLWIPEWKIWKCG